MSNGKGKVNATIQDGILTRSPGQITSHARLQHTAITDQNLLISHLSTRLPYLASLHSPACWSKGFNLHDTGAASFTNNTGSSSLHLCLAPEPFHPHAHLGSSSEISCPRRWETHKRLRVSMSTTLFHNTAYPQQPQTTQPSRPLRSLSPGSTLNPAETPSLPPRTHTHSCINTVARPFRPPCQTHSAFLLSQPLK